MICATSYQQTSSVRVLKHASNRHVDIKERETCNALQKLAAKQSRAREDGIGGKSTVYVFLM